MSGSASAHWHGGGAFAAGAIAGAALSSPYVAPRYYYGGPVVAPGYAYPVCPLYRGPITAADEPGALAPFVIRL